MSPDKDKRFTEDFIRKWSRAGGARKKKRLTKNEKILKNQEEILKKDPRNHKIWFARGILLTEMGKFPDAIRCFDAVMKLDPKNKAVFNSKASALMQMGDASEAARWYKRALEVSSRNVDEETRARLIEDLPAEEVIREMIEESRGWEETIRTRDCPICGSSVLRTTMICPTCEWEFYDEEYKELLPEEKKVRPESELTEGEQRERLIQKVETYRLEGFEVSPLIRTLKTEPHRAKSAVAQFEENVKEIKGFREKLKSLDTTEFETKIIELEQLFRSPYNIYAIRNEFEKLLSRIEARGAKRAARPRVPVARRPAAEGLTNGLRGRVNGLGRERAGLTNGRRGRVNGMVNGLTNGLGRVNGMINGVGRVNGLTNGLVYRFQAMKTGLVNGLTNGNGITNGLGSMRFQNESKMRKWKLTIIPTVAFMLLTLSFFIYAEVPISDIVVDGEFEDWSGVTRIASARNVSLPSNIDIVAVAARNDNRYLSLYAEVDNVALWGNPITGVPDTIHFLLDVDDDASTGYLVRGTGSDYLVQVFGFGGNVLSSRLYSFKPYADQTNWSAWDVEEKPKASVSENMLETQVSLKAIGTIDRRAAILVHAHSFDGYSDFSDNIVSDQKGVLVVDQLWSSEAEELSGSNNVILTINARALAAKIEMNSLTIHLTGNAAPTEISRLRILASGTELDSINSPQSKTLTFTFGTVEIDEDETTVFSIDASVGSPTGNTLGVKVSYSSDFGLSSGVASLLTTFPEGSMNYVGPADTDNIKVDGGFSDWTDLEEDQSDVNDTVRSANINIAEFATVRVQRALPSIKEDAFFYVEVTGMVAGGSLVPYKSPGPIKEYVHVVDSDNDTAPDSLDDFPYDFNNDGIPDADTNFDFDADGTQDYPTGSDLFLETVLPSSFPFPYGGRTVKVYIGPRTVPAITGEDYMNIYIDIDGDVGGFAVGPIFADRLLLIRGKNGDITMMEFLEFDGSGPTIWKWKATGEEVSASADRHRLEAYADITLLGGTMFEVVFEGSDWENRRDLATNISEGRKSATRGSYGEYDAKYVSPNYEAYMTDLADKVSFNRKDAHLSWSIPRRILWDGESDSQILGDLKPSDLVLGENRVTYNDVYSNLDVSIDYIFNDNMLKENVILENPIANLPETGHLSLISRLQYTKDLMVYAEGEESGEWTFIDGELAFKERDLTMFYIASPFAVDSTGDVLECQYLFGAAANMLNLRCPSDWFLSASYPVAIDPTVTYTLENDNGTLGQASEFFGWSVAIGDFDNDSYADIATGAPYTNISSYTLAGAVYIYYGPFSGDDTSPDVMIVANNTGKHLGWAIGAGKFTNDDYWDLVVTQIDDDAYAYYGYDGWVGWDATPNATFDLSSFKEEGETLNFGNAVAVGNIDYSVGLNYDDVVFGANLSDNPGNGPSNLDGMAYVFISPFATTEVGEDARLYPNEHSNDGEFATSLACGKLDNDDKYDVISGEPMVNGSDGMVHIFYGDNIGVIGVGYYTDAYLEYEYSAEKFGLSVAVGSLDSDSYDDILVGAPENSEYGSDKRGRAYIYQANSDGSGITDEASPDVDLAGPDDADGAEFGYSVAVEDFDGDGTGDAIVGARYNASGGTKRGSIMIFEDPLGTNNATDYFVNGTQDNEYLGWSVTARNFSNDQWMVMAAGAPFWDDASPSETDAGRVMVIIPEYLDKILFFPLMIAIPIILRRRRKKSL